MKRIIFDNSNLNESYSGVTTPLTFTFAKRVYRAVYIEFSRVIGTSEKKINENSSMYDAMLGYICGRMYYNMLNWYLLISFIPGYSFNRSFFEKMLGVSKTTDYDPRPKKKGYDKFADFALLIKQTFILIKQFAFLNKNVAIFLKDFDQEFKRVNAIDIRRLSDHELVQFYLNHELKFSNKWKITIVNDVAVMISTGIARSMARSWLNDKNNESINRYLSSIKNLVSAKPGEQVKKIISLIQNDRRALLLFKNQNADQILTTLKSDRRLVGLKQQIARYIEDYGDRVPGELKLESITYKDDEKRFISLLKNQLTTKKYKEVIVNDDAPDVDGKLFQMNILKKILFRFVINWSRSCIRNRESARLRRSQVFGFARKVFNEFGLRLFLARVISKQSDIFYLDVDEVIGLHNGVLTDLNVKPLIEKRKKNINLWNRIEVPERVDIDYPVHHFERIMLSRLKKRDSKKLYDNISLRGITYSSGLNGGVISGEALVLKNFNSNVSYVNKILVTKQTDPGWTPVFGQIKGLVVERGGMLSHAAIVAREFGLPCISQVKDATNIIKSGQIIQLNLKMGDITINK